MYKQIVLDRLRKQSGKIVCSYNLLCKQIFQYFELAKVRNSFQPNVLICACSLMKNGGIEKRIMQYREVWEKEGYKVLLGAREGNGPIDIFFTSYCWYNMFLLWRLKRNCNIRVVEFEVGGMGRPFLNFALLRWWRIRSGVILHASSVLGKYDYLNKADYVICSHAAHGKRVPFLKKYPILPNAVTKKEQCWQFAGQKEALLISRLSGDKKQSIESFIFLCLAWNMPFQIAGDFSDEKGRNMKLDLQRHFHLDKSVFLGYVETEKFLQKSWRRFLFVGGVGQVILEAGQLGYPCLLASLLGVQRSFWVTRKNVAEVINYNCSPHSTEESFSCKQNQNLEDCFHDIRVGNTDLYAVGNFINENCELGKCLERYKLLTQGEKFC